MVLSESNVAEREAPHPLLSPKGLFDIAVAASLVVALSPLFLATALLVMIAVGRPVLFRQPRCGKNLKTFTISKFRTMTDERDAEGELLPDADRQTRLTNILRRLRFDELPQLIAVLRRDMSFVGPRPLGVETIRRHGAAGRLRCSVSPGLTGWAQVNGNTRLTEEEKFALDLWYIDHQSMMLDIRIVLLTLRTLFLGEIVNRRSVETALAELQRKQSLAPRSEAEE